MADGRSERHYLSDMKPVGTKDAVFGYRPFPGEESDGVRKKREGTPALHVRACQTLCVSHVSLITTETVIPATSAWR